MSNDESDDNDEDKSNSTGSDDSDTESINSATNLPSYLTGTFKLGDSVNNNDVEENDAEEGTGGDSDNEVSEMAELQEAMAEVALNRMEAEINDEGDENIIGLCNVFDVVSDEDKVPLERHKPPDDWVDPPPKPNTGQPPFDEVDNPGGWPSFTF